MIPIEFESTPNPDALRVRAPGVGAPGAPRSFLAGTRVADPLAAALLGVPGLVRVMIARDFMTVIRRGSKDAWAPIRAKVALILADASEKAPVGETPMAAPLLSTAPQHERGEIEAQIEQVLDRWVRPLLAADGGEAVLVRFDPEDGTAWVRMEGACGGCPSGTITLKRGIEQAIRRWVPEVTAVRAAKADDADEDDDLPRDPRARFRAWIAAKWGGQKD